jgi:hypothetical protein
VQPEELVEYTLGRTFFSRFPLGGTALWRRNLRKRNSIALEGAKARGLVMGGDNGDDIERVRERARRSISRLTSLSSSSPSVGSSCSLRTIPTLPMRIVHSRTSTALTEGLFNMLKPISLIQMTYTVEYAGILIQHMEQLWLNMIQKEKMHVIPILAILYHVCPLPFHKMPENMFNCRDAILPFCSISLEPGVCQVKTF